MKRISTIPLTLVLAALLLAAGVSLFESRSSGGKPPSESAASPAPARTESENGLVRVVLTERARERLDITTAPVTAAPLAVPYAAVLYEPQGSTWVYANPAPLVYVRQRIEVERIEGERAILLSGPPVGATVVTSGAAELLGVELGVGK